MAGRLSDLLIRLQSYRPWSADDWENLLPKMEELIGSPLSRLDERNPMRRKVDGCRGQGAYIHSFKGSRSWNYVAGEFGQSKIWFTIETQRRPSRIENQMKVFIPAHAASSIGNGLIARIFDIALQCLDPFYMVADVETVIYSRKPSPPCTIVHHSYELSGVYWLTYFGPKYRAFFGDERFEGLPHEWTEEGGVKLKLGDNPWLLEDEKRRAAEKALGELTFASYGENKKENEHVIPWPELLEGEWIAEHQRREAAGIKPWEFG